MVVAAWDEATAWQADNSESPFRFASQLVAAWSCLWTIGDRKILDRGLLGLLCSSRCPGDTILRTYDLARALRDARTAVIGGFHSPMEQECLDFLLRGNQPLVVCPARAIQGMRLPAAWRNPIEQGRLLVLSPFSGANRRPTLGLAEKRNRLVAELARRVFVAHAAPGSKTEALCREMHTLGKELWTFENSLTPTMQTLGMRGFPSVRLIIETLDQEA